MASYVCEKNKMRELNHTPLINDKELNIADFLAKEGIYFTHNREWCNNVEYEYYSCTFNENGLCMTYNSIKANMIFRTEKVDPAFLRQYEIESYNTMPQLWSMEDGYKRNSIKNYPKRSFDSGLENGFKIRLETDMFVIRGIDTACQSHPNNFKIALHHPAEILSNQNKFFEVPFYKSVSIIVKPKITRTSESLRSYDPNV
jgi:amiloride-sensitive sodium channel